MHRKIATTLSLNSLPEAEAATAVCSGGRTAGVEKVIFVLRSVTAGGAENHLLQLMTGLRAHGVVCIYAGPADGWLGRQAQAAGFQCEDIAFRGLWDLASMIRLIRLVRREQPDIVHGHLTRGAYYSGLASMLTGIPNVATAHSTNAGKRFGLAQRIIAVSEAVHGFLVERGYSRQVLRTILHGVPDGSALQHISPDTMRKELQLDGSPMLAMLARFTPDKGQDVALRALAGLRHLPWTLVLAGSLETAYAGEMQLLAGELGIADRVRFVGHRDDVASLYRCADIVLAPSRREALSLTLLEAAAFGVPVIASKVGGIGEAVIDGETGLLIPSGDVVALADALQRLLADRALQRRLGQAANRRYRRHFTLEAMVAETLELYRELAARSAF